MKIFISYARDGGCGQNLATEVQQRLQVAGFSVFRDVEGLKPGDVWYHKLEFELESSDLMVVVVSEKVRRSEWVANEVQLAREIGIPVIPVLAEKIRLPLWLRSLQHLDFCQETDWSFFVKTLNGYFPVTSDEVDADLVQVDTKESIISRKVVDNLDWVAEGQKDDYGLYAELRAHNVITVGACGSLGTCIQKFRWIEPGDFWTGSPDHEVGRRDDEYHFQATVNGFWLADTACTQELWELIMGRNPSSA